MNLVLIGLMGSGKSAVGRLLAQMLGRPLRDTDAEVEREAGMTIAEIFASEGEAGFRAREEAVIARLTQDGAALTQDGAALTQDGAALTEQGAHRSSSAAGWVIATGGGAVLAPGNREALRSNGLIFWLDASPAELYRRAARQGLERRPLLGGPNPQRKLAALAASRAAAYRQAAHHRIVTEGLTQQQVANMIAAIWSRHKGENGYGPGAR